MYKHRWPIDSSSHLNWCLCLCWWAYCVHSCIKDMTVLSHCHFCDQQNCRRTGYEVFLEVVEAILAQNALKSQAHVSRALQSQDSSLDFVSANLFQQEYWLESAAPVSIRLWTICYHHMQILSFKTFCCQISQRFRLAESELYSCFHILPDTFVGELNITP